MNFKSIEMKKTVIVIALLFSMGMTLSAQIRKIPSEVTDTFSIRYPTARKVSWKDNLVGFEASFTVDSAVYVAKFSNKGEWLETDKKIEFNKLSAEIKDGFNKSKYTGWEIRGVMEIAQKGKETVYRILVRKSTLQKIYLFYNKTGQLQKEQTAL
jgi:hypothetical protein